MRRCIYKVNFDPKKTKNYLGVHSLAVLLAFLPLFALSCKKSPTMPNAEELTRPVIWLNTFELAFSAYESGGNPEAQIFQIKNSGQNTLQYTISDDADLLSVEPGNGASSGQLVGHTVLINKAGLAAQEADYEATVTSPAAAMATPLASASRGATFCPLHRTRAPFVSARLAKKYSTSVPYVE